MRDCNPAPPANAKKNNLPETIDIYAICYNLNIVWAYMQGVDNVGAFGTYIATLGGHFQRITDSKLLAHIPRRGNSHFAPGPNLTSNVVADKIRDMGIYQMSWG